MLRHLTAALLVSALAAAALPASVSAAPATKSHRVTAGKTVLTLDPAASANLQSMGIAMTAGAPASTAGSILTFPLKPGATVKTRGNKVLSGTLEHQGTLSMAQGAVVILLSKPTLKFGPPPVFTGSLGGLAIEIGTLSFKNAKTRVTGKGMTISGIAMKLTKLAADSMNGTFAVTGFKAGDPVGKAVLTATWKR